MRRPSVPTIALAALALGACGGGGGGSPTQPDPPSSSPPEPSVSTVEVEPASAGMDALGQTRQFSATVRASDGSVLDGVAVDWSASPGAVATVDGDGTATGQGEGTATIRATAEGVSGTAELTVEQVPTAVEVSPAEVTISSDGETVQLGAEAFDANGHGIDDAAFAWSSSDESVATVDAEGLVTGRAEGTVQVEATVEGPADPPSAVSAVTVEAAGPDAPPVIDAVDPMTELRTATIRGSGFAPELADNTVTVDGVEATVTSAAAGELTVEVPQLGCVPAHRATVEVSTSAGSDGAAADLTPDEAPLGLAVGDQAVLTGGGSYCLSFEATAADERYLVGVQSLSAAVDGLTGVAVTAEAADGTGTAARTPRSLATRSPGSSAGRLPVRSPLRAVHRAAESRLRAWERRHLDPSASLPAREGAGGARTARVVDGPVEVGDTVTIRVPDIGGSNLCLQFFEIGAVVRAVGERGILVSDTANPSNGFTDADYREFSDRMDAEIFATLVDHFGEPTDLDGNGRVVVVVSKEVNRGDPDILGFVFPGDLFPRSSTSGSSCASSDEGEFYYAKAPDPAGEFGDVYETEDARSIIPPNMAHELTHVIQSSRRFQADAPFMVSRVSEAQANLGEEVVGHDATGRSPGQNLGATVIFNANDTDEVDWYLDGFVDLARYFGFEDRETRVPDAPDACGWWRGDPAPCAGRALWYGVGWSFLRWVTDHHAASVGGEQALHRSIIDRGGRGIENVAAIVGEPVEELMAQWSAMLYLDDRNAASAGPLSWPSWDLFDFEQNTVETADLVPFEETFRDWQAVGDVRASSTGYVAVEGGDRPATTVTVGSRSGGPLPAEVQVWVVRIR